MPPRSTFREPGSEGHAVPRSRDRLIYATDTAVLRVDPDGREEWRLELGARGPDRAVAYTDVALSADESLVWVYVPNAMADRGRPDEWITTIDEYDMSTLGDGTYVITDTDGTLRRM